MEMIFTNDFDELPKCHYCPRYAFEIAFQGIMICDKCLEKMTAQHVWRVVRDASGSVWVTTSENTYNFEVLGEGTFTEMWDLCHKDDPNYG